MKVIKLQTKEDVTSYLADLILKQVETKPNSVLGLATGSTPTLAYHEIVKRSLIDQVDFSKVVTFNLDEYIGLEEFDRNSYRTFMDSNLFDYINIKQENTFLPNVNSDEYSDYDKLIKEYGGIDFQVLGIGENGHIGFNEPGTDKDTLTHKVTLAENTRVNNAKFFDSIDDVPKEAVTMGITSILNAKKIVLVATGTNKKDIMYKVLNEGISKDIPASYLKEHKDVIIVVDEEAGAYIKEMDL